MTIATIRSTRPNIGLDRPRQRLLGTAVAALVAVMAVLLVAAVLVPVFARTAVPSGTWPTPQPAPAPAAGRHADPRRQPAAGRHAGPRADPPRAPVRCAAVPGSFRRCG